LHINITPNTGFNLLSVTQLMKEGVTFQLSNSHGSCLKYNDNWFPIQRQSNLLVIDLTRPLTQADTPPSVSETPLETAFFTSSATHAESYNSDDTSSPEHHTAFKAAAAPVDIWHARLAHVNNKRLHHINKTGSGLGLNIIGSTSHNASCKCDACLKTNNISRSVGKFREFADTVARKGELLTTDIIGPYPPDPDGNRFAISFTDEFSRFSNVFFLKKKSEAVDALRAVILYYRSLNVIISKLRNDQAGEFGGHHDRASPMGGGSKLDTADFYTPAFLTACKKANIIPELTPAHRPEIHGVAERWNRTVMTMANSMMYKARISPLLWTSAVAHANTIRNRLPTASRGGHTPYEIFTNRLPRYENFRIWGSFCYKLIPGCKKIPGLPVRTRLLYVGESSDRIGFRCFNPETCKYTTEYELIFDEASVANRASLLEAFDHRRKTLHNHNIDVIKLIADLDPPDGYQRSVFLPSDDTSGASLTPSTSLEGDADTPLPPGTTYRDNGCCEVPSKLTPSTLQSNKEDLINLPNEETAVESGTPPGDSTTVAKLTVPPFPKRSGSGSNTHSYHPDTNETQDTCQSDTSPSSSSATNNGKAAGITASPSAMKNASPAPKNGKQPPPINESRLSASNHAFEAVMDAPMTLDNFDSSESIDLLRSESRLKQQPPIEYSSTLSHSASSMTGDDFNIDPDAEASNNGPLLPDNITKHNRRFTFDFHPRHLRCSQRYLPINAAEDISPDINQFLALARTHNLEISIQQNNPKQLQKKSHKRYELTKHCTNVAQYLNLHKHIKGDNKRGVLDLREDFLRGWITFPKNTSEYTPISENQHACYASAFSSQTMLDDTTAVFHKQDDDTVLYTSLLATDAPTMTDTFQSVIQAIWPHDPEPTAEALNQRDLDASALMAEVLFDDLPDPTSYHRAIDKARHDRLHWQKAIDKETATLLDRDTWTYVLRKSLKKRPIRCKFVLKKKFVKDGSTQYKARLVACGITQQAGHDYSSDETYASVCSYSSMRFLMSLSTQKGYLLYQTDIQGAYLESYLEDELYMDVPPNLPQRDKHGNQLVCKLQRGLYGLKQAGYAWSLCFKDFMMTDPKYNMGFSAMSGEPNLYRKTLILNDKQEHIYVGQYVDDCLLAASSQEALDWFTSSLGKRFPVNPASSGLITDESPGLLLSMHVRYNINTGILQFDQKRAIESLAKKFKIDERKVQLLPMSPDDNLPKLLKPEKTEFITQYLSMVGSCLHICQVSRPDCAYAVGVLSRHAATPGEIHMKAARHLIGYLYSTKNWCIQYTKTHSGNDPLIYEKYHFPDSDKADKPPDLSRTIEERLVASVPSPTPNVPITFCANLGGDKVTRKSTSGLVIMMNGGPIAWSSRLQKLCAQSSAEAEINAVVESVKEALHIRLLCEEAGIRSPGQPMNIWEDNNACIQMAHHIRGSNAAKHYELRLRFLNEHIWEKNIEFSRIDTTDQLADPFTKALPLPKFRQFRNILMVNNSPSTPSHEAPLSNPIETPYYNLDDLD
jgi:hypothetical protein